MKRGREPFKSFGISQTYPQQEGKKCVYLRCQDADFGVKMSWESWFCRDISPKFARAKRALGGVDPCPEKWGARGGIRTVNPDHPRRKPPQVADEEGWKHKRRLSRGEISLLLAPPTHPPHLWPATTPYLLHKAQTLRRRQVLRGNLKLGEL